MTVASLPSLIDRIQQLIAAPSISSSMAQFDQSNMAVIELLANWLESLGFSTYIQEVKQSHNPTVKKANLIATLGEGSGGLVLSGHTDTVPCNPEIWTSDPFTLTERDQKLYGLGTCDMKGFFSLAIEAATKFAELHKQTPLKHPLIILATADEESSMSGARALTEISQETGLAQARYALIGEPTSLRPIRTHKGIMMETVRLTGKAGHSSNPALGVNSIDAMTDVLLELKQFRYELSQNYQNADFEIAVPTMNFGCIHGGDNPNRICGRCELEFDLRALPGMSNDDLRDLLRNRLAPVADKHSVEFELASLFPGVPAFATEKTADIVKVTEKLTKHTSHAVAFATEAPFMQQLGMETIVLGPGSIDQAHQVDEYLALDQIEPTVELLENLIGRFCL